MADGSDERLLDIEVLPDCPLLGPDQSSPSHRAPRSPWFVTEKPQAISALTCLAIFLWVFSGMLSIVPGTRLVEDIFCRRYYGRGAAIDEEMCKVPEVQSKIAYLFGFSMTVASLVTILVAFPFGILADRARKPVYLLSAVGQCLSIIWSLLVFHFSDTLPIELAMLSPILSLLGGGLTVAMTILYAIISDVQTPENRAISYFYFSLSAQCAVFAGPPIGSKLMGVWSPWVPMFMVLIVSALAGVIIFLIPETAGRANTKPDDEDLWKRGWYDAAKSHIKHRLRDAGRSLQMLKQRSMALILLTFMLIYLMGIGTAGPTFLQYFSTRFHRRLEDAGYVLAIKGGLTILVMAVVLPALSKLLSSPTSPIRLSSFRRDLILAQASAAFSFIGFLALTGPDVGYVIAGLMVLTLGSGLGPLCRSLLINFAEPGQTSQLFTVVSIIETIGSLTGGPVLAWTFSTGMHLQGFWAALPFIFLSVLSFLSLVALCLIRHETPASDYSQLVDQEPQSVDGES
ncbi:MFS general substrate transporter [Hypoxylon crocopeplum]|nr:MFS general substrate transporter [Hypoxylon crocopeplum]